MKKLPIFTLVCLLLAGGVTLGYGQDEYPDHRSGKKIVDLLHEHEKRIEDGEHSGELTRHEAEHLREKENFVREKLDYFLHQHHGYVTDNEEFSLESSMSKISEDIHRAKHNGTVR